MIERARAALAGARKAGMWPDLAYVEDKDPDGYDRDGNAGRRALVLWGLQYDWRADELPFHRFLAEQEALCRENAPMGGAGDEYDIAGYLLARHRLVEDVWRQWRLKNANSDTYYAYDVEALAVAGVAETVAYVRASDHPDRDDVLARLLREPVVTDEAVTRYFARKARWYPADPDEESAGTWEQRAEFLEYW